MKSTKLILAFLGTLLITFLTLGLIGYLLSDADVTYKQCLTHGAMWFIMLTFGWIPSMFVCFDLNEKLK